MASPSHKCSMGHQDVLKHRPSTVLQNPTSRISTFRTLKPITMAADGENPSQETIIDERQELLISPNGGQSTLRTAHFLKPPSSSASVKNPPLYPLTSNRTITGSKEPPLKVKFSGGKYQLELWASWVHQLLPKYYRIWKKAGIYEAILSSTYPIIRNPNLIICLAEKWNYETNTFVFQWGESTLTLEDMRILGGYSVLGYPVLGRPEETRKIAELSQELCLAHREIRKKGESQTFWMKHFMGSGHLLEHEAFLALWLARYVLPSGYDIDGGNIFPLAVHLSRGTRIALAPAVLASIYTDLRILKKSMNSSLNLSYSEIEQGSRITVQLWAPFQLVMMWVWERFPTLRPNPKSIQPGDPRSARWHGLEDSFKLRNVRELLDSAGDCFQWRPYVVVLNNWKLNKFYRETDELVMVNQGMNRELASFVICIRVSELVGLDCIEQYLPHRVAMQFGYDQDVPGDVPRLNRSFEEAWSNYCRPVRDEVLYIPTRLFESDVTARYYSWRASSELASKDVFKNGIARKPRSITKKRLPQACWGNSNHHQALIVPGSRVDRASYGEMIAFIFHFTDGTLETDE